VGCLQRVEQLGDEQAVELHDRTLLPPQVVLRNSRQGGREQEPGNKVVNKVKKLIVSSVSGPT
jgi:hypothetical protein